MRTRKPPLARNDYKRTGEHSPTLTLHFIFSTPNEFVTSKLFISYFRPLNSEDSIQKCFKERRALKVSSFTNAKLCPEWYYKLFIPTDTLDEVKMNTACAEESFQFH